MDERVSRSRASGALFVGDVLAIATFVVLGELRHGQPLTGAPETAAPFLVGWLLLAPVAGAYGPGIGPRTRASVLTAGAAWVGAALVGQALRATDYVDGGVDPAFVAVSVVVGLALIVGWRVLAAQLLAR